MSDKEPLSKATALPAVSVGFAIALFGLALWVGQFKAEKEAEHIRMTSAIERNTRRFNSYSGKDGSNTSDIEAVEAELAALKLWITEQHGGRPR